MSQVIQDTVKMWSIRTTKTGTMVKILILFVYKIFEKLISQFKIR